MSTSPHSPPPTATGNSAGHMMLDLASPLAIAQSYKQMSWCPVPVPYRTKKCVLRGWSGLRIDIGDLARYFNCQPQNIGVLLGEPSGGLTDVDLDCPEAIRLAPRMLPRTGCVFGRPGKPSSHWLYTVAPALKSKAYKDVDGSMLVELRSTGAQTVMPGSTHESGEPIRFENAEYPTSLDGQRVGIAVGVLAAAVLLGRHLRRPGSRHNAALALAGGLLRAGWEQQEIVRFIEAVAVAADDDEVQDRIKAVESTIAKMEAGEPVTGWPALVGMVGDEVVNRAMQWLGIKTVQEVIRSTGASAYRETDTGMVWMRPTQHGDVPVPISNWKARILADVLQDDGVETVRCFEMEGQITGEAPVRFMIPAEQFAAMSWPIRQLGAKAMTFPGQSLESHARCAIQSMSSGISQRVIYTHIGWRQVGSTWVYFHADGGIGATGPVGGLEVRVTDALGLYSLPAPPVGEALTTSLQATLGLMDLGPAVVTVPLLAAVFRAVLREADYSIFIAGKSGAFKTELAALAQQHFGMGMDSRHLPCNWSSTANAQGELAFLAKDAVLTVDDFKPSGVTGEDQRLNQQADRVLRAQGNRSGRQRMRQDGSLRPTRPVRALLLCTGEDVPRGESLRARLLVLDLTPGDITSERLTIAQDHARRGLYAETMAAFCQWLAPQLEETRGWLLRRSAELRPTFAGGHARLPDLLSGLYAALEVFFKFAVEASSGDAISKTEAADELNRCRRALADAGRRQSVHRADTDPAQRFSSLLNSALAAGRAHVAGLDGAAPTTWPGAWGWRAERNGSFEELRALGDRIGWIDGDSLYLDPDASYKVAQAQAAGGEPLAVTVQTLRKRLYDAGQLVSNELETRNTYTTRISVAGKRQQVIHVRTTYLGVEEPSGDQEASGAYLTPPQDT